MTHPAPARATEIPVKDFRQIFVWPLVLDKKPGENWFNDLSKKICGPNWKKVSDLWQPVTGKQDDNDNSILGTYEEAVYFHDFVRDFLYQKDGDAQQKVFQRKDLKTLTATIGDGTSDKDYHFAIDHCTLHFFPFGVAILTLELGFDAGANTPLTLDQAQTLIDYLRRAYAPFWKDGAPGLSPKNVTINDVPCGLGDLQDRTTASAAMHKRGFREPMFPWWEHILAPLVIEGTKAAKENKEPVFRQVLDERIPVMTTLSLTRGEGHRSNLERVSDGDWFRLAAADAAGNDPYPYNPDFLEHYRDSFFYDRFHAHRDGGQSGATRFLFAGYHFAAVGAGWFFDNLVTEHMRRHYRQMVFIVQLEHATLLMLSSRLSHAAKHKNLKNETKNFRTEVIEIENEFLNFTHRYRFTGVSNQLQGTEIYDKLRQSMGIDRLFDDVRTELQQASEFALALEQHEATEASHQLTEVATLGVVIGIVVGALGMNVLIGKPLESCLTKIYNLTNFGLAFDLLQAGAILAITAFLTLLFVFRNARCKLKISLIILVMCGLLTSGFSWFGLHPQNAAETPPAQNQTTQAETNEPDKTTQQTPSTNDLKAPPALNSPVENN
ncbi:hypothetical protein [uncultured Thalassospira sp.]|uniref:hypothetical protein n=1 Tax=uncultured Thalassospira sp. TaxID=404382 RepID=UPI0030DD7799